MKDLFAVRYITYAGWKVVCLPTQIS